MFQKMLRGVSLKRRHPEHVETTTISKFTKENEVFSNFLARVNFLAHDEYAQVIVDIRSSYYPITQNNPKVADAITQGVGNGSHNPTLIFINSYT
jgi:hypothetical protein